MDAVGVGVDSEAEEVELGFRLEINGWAVKLGREELLKVCGVLCG